MRSLKSIRLAALATAAVGALACSVTPALAQSNVRNLDRETSDVRTYTGTISGGSTDFNVTLDAGKALIFEAAAAPGSSLDPYLRVVDRGTGEVLAENDDGPNGLAAYAVVYSEKARNLRLEVSQTGAGDSDASGDFELTLRPSTYRPQPPRPISNNSSLTGELVAGENNQFMLDAVPGQVYSVSLDAADGSGIDPVLEIYRGDGVGGEMLASDDDGGDSLNARLQFAVTEAGTYTLVAKAYGQGSGRYVVRLGNPAEQAQSTSPLNFGETVSGRIGGSDAGQSAYIYRLSDSALEAIQSNPQMVSISMEGLGASEGRESSIDPMLEIGFDTPMGFATLASDDDGGEGLNSLLSVDLSGMGNDRAMLERLRIKATSYGTGAGAFTILLTTNTGFILLGEEGAKSTSADDTVWAPTSRQPAPVNLAFHND